MSYQQEIVCALFDMSCIYVYSQVTCERLENVINPCTVNT